MNLLQKWILGSELRKFYSGYSGLKYEFINGQLISSADNRQVYLSNGYNVNDIIYSCINLICEKVRVAQWGVYKVEDESSLKSYKSITLKNDITGDDFVKALQFKKKALTAYKDSKLQGLLDYPNDYCTFSDLVADSSIFKLITGDRYIWADLLPDGANTGKPQSLWLLPSQDVFIIAGKTFPLKEIGYELWKGLIDNSIFTVESIMHDKYLNPNYSTYGAHLYGLAPLKAALKLTDRSNESNKTATAMFQNQGPKKVLFFDDQRFQPENFAQQAKDVKNILHGNEYAGGDNAGKFAISGVKMGAVDVGLSPADLQIIESEKWDLRRFCNVFGGIPSQLLNDPENKSYNNAKEGEKALTTRGAIPLLNSFRDHINRKFSNDWGYKGQNVYVDYDIASYSELQDDLETKWAWVKELPVPNRYKLDMLNLDYDDTWPWLDEVLVPSGFMPIDQVNQVDQTLNNDITGNPGQGG